MQTETPNGIQDIFTGFENVKGIYGRPHLSGAAAVGHILTPQMSQNIYICHLRHRINSIEDQMQLISVLLIFFWTPKL